jgi:hypothetical protein
VGAKPKKGGGNVLFDFFRIVTGEYRSPSSLDVIKIGIEIDRSVRDAEVFFRDHHPDRELQQELFAITAQINWMCVAKQGTRDEDDRRIISENIEQLLALHKELRPY